MNAETGDAPRASDGGNDPRSIGSGSTEAFVRSLYTCVLRREPDAGGLQSWIDALDSGRSDPAHALNAFADSQELRDQREKRAQQIVAEDEVFSYVAPQQLAVTPLLPTRVLLLGSCLLESWAAVIQNTGYCSVDFINFNNLMKLPPRPPHGPEAYDFQILQIPLRTVLPETEYLPLSYQDEGAYEALFARASERVTRFLEAMARWNIEHGLLSFVSNFLVPQQNPMGRLLPRYDLRNPVYFIERLNLHLARALEKYSNMHLLDIEQMSALFGKKYYQDDALALLVHHSGLSNFDVEYDANRIETPVPPLEQHPVRGDQFVSAVWADLVAMYRTLRQTDQVKLVIMDLDDSLWRGIAAEGALDTYGEKVIEGWPLGVIEALQFLKKRGILLAIVSKNDERTISELWPRMVGQRIALDDFATRKINWRPKAENIADILRDVNVLPKNVLFVDDNPVERAAVLQAFPAIRTLGANPYAVKRTLLWAAETQVAGISAESGRRTEMIQAQVRREAERDAQPHDAFLNGLGVRVEGQWLKNAGSPLFARAFELLNKTNQFNTTGKRWTHEEVTAFFRQGGAFYVFTVGDRFTDYGLVGVAALIDRCVAQWAMSCRVLGLDVELAAMRQLAEFLAGGGATTISGRITPTDANFLARDLFERCGFSIGDDAWHRTIDLAAWASPAHITVTAARP